MRCFNNDSMCNNFIGQDVLNTYCWIHSTYTIPRYKTNMFNIISKYLLNKPDLKTLRDPSPDPIQSSVPSGSGSVLMLHTREWTRPRILWNGAITNTTSGSASAFSSRYFYPIRCQFYIGKVIIFPFPHDCFILKRTP